MILGTLTLSSIEVFQVLKNAFPTQIPFKQLSTTRIATHLIVCVEALVVVGGDGIGVLVKDRSQTANLAKRWRKKFEFN